jgi:cbb3-type cytochrome oxidase subunit 3
MKQDGLQYFTDVHLTGIALLLFFGFFMGMIFYVFKKSKGDWEQISKLPLQEDCHERR